MIPDYRIRVFEELRRRLGVENFAIAAGDRYFGGTPEASPLAANLGPLPLQNRYFAREKLLWQRGVLRIWKSPVLLAELNPRALSTWTLLLLRRASGKCSIVWGHHTSRAIGDGRPGHARLAMIKLSDGVVFYTVSGLALYEAAVSHGRPAFAAPNALYPSCAMVPLPRQSNVPATDIIVVGRLIPGKKVDLVIRAFYDAQARLPATARLVIVGDGPERARLEAIVASSSSARVVFMGHIDDPAELRRLHARAMFTVSGGYVGLSAIQSLAFGIPVLFADQEPHAPEVEALTPANSLSFRAGDATALAQSMCSLAAQATAWDARRVQISQECRQSYSLEGMVTALAAAINEIRPQCSTGGPRRMPSHGGVGFTRS